MHYRLRVIERALGQNFHPTYSNFYVRVLTQFRIKFLHVEVLTNFRIKLLHIEFSTIFPGKTSTTQLSASFYPSPKYSRYIFRGQNAQFSIGTKQQKGGIECLCEFQIFYQGIIAQIFGKSICYFKSPIYSCFS